MLPLNGVEMSARVGSNAVDAKACCVSVFYIVTRHAACEGAIHIAHSQNRVSCFAYKLWILDEKSLIPLLYMILASSGISSRFTVSRRCLLKPL